jgi:hypothetical protein
MTYVLWSARSHQIACGISVHFGFGAAELAGQARDTAAECGTSDDVLVDQVRHFVARPAQPPFGALERQARLPHDEFGEAGGQILVGIAGRAPTLAQLGERRRFTDDDRAAIGMAPRDVPLAQRTGVARIAEGDQVGEAGHAHASRWGGCQATRRGCIKGSSPCARRASSAGASSRFWRRRDGGIGITSYPSLGPLVWIQRRNISSSMRLDASIKNTTRRSSRLGHEIG